MSALRTDPATGERIAALGPYARYALERAVGYALRLHAEEVSSEHLLASLLEDEECGATRIVLHAFADPETLGIEVLALCDGIMVVGSERCLPFSVRGVRLLDRARASAAERADASVTPHHLFACALGELSDAPAQALRASGFAPEAFELGARIDEGSEGDPVPAQGPLLQRFSQAARRALGAAARTAARLGRTEISPAHVLLGALDASDELAEDTGLSSARVRLLLGGGDADPTPLPSRAIAPDAALVDLLAALGRGAGTADVLARIVSHGRAEVRALLSRQKITPAVVERARGAFDDPEPPPHKDASPL